MRLYILSIFILIGFTSIAQETFTLIDNSDKLRTEFKSSTQTLSSIHSDFIQEKYLAYLTTTVVSKGKFWYKTPNKLRWEYTEPFKFMVIMNGDKIIVKDENQTNAYKNKPNNTFQMLNEVLASSVNGTLIDNPDYSFEVAENSNDYRIVMSPNKEEAKKMVDKIEMLFSKTNLSVYEITMFEPGGDTIKIKFENKRVNQAISDQVFAID